MGNELKSNSMLERKTLSAARAMTAERVDEESLFSKYVAALGLLSTLHPALVMDVDDPLGMAQEIHKHVCSRCLPRGDVVVKRD